MDDLVIECKREIVSMQVNIMDTEAAINHRLTLGLYTAEDHSKLKSLNNQIKQLHEGIERIEARIRDYELQDQISSGIPSEAIAAKVSITVEEECILRPCT